MSEKEKMLNYIGGRWLPSSASEYLDVVNPATAAAMASVPLSPALDVDAAAEAAAGAFKAWRQTPPVDRVQFLFKLKNLLEESLEDLARTVTMECGKTLEESRGEVRRLIENVEVACGIPMLMQGYNSEDIAPGIDKPARRARASTTSTASRPSTTTTWPPWRWP